MAKFTKIPTNTFSQLGINAGVLLSEFTPATPTLEDEKILGATSGGVNFTAVPTFTDYGEDIDNCPKNSKELKQLDSWEIKMSGTFITISLELGQRLAALADAGTSTNKLTPRGDVSQLDFKDIWFVGDYSDKTGATKGGYIAIRVMDALSTGGFALQSADRGKMKFAFEFTAHYSLEKQEVVPFEIYIKAGEDET